MASERCAVVGCEFYATGSCLHAAGGSAVQFAICDVHLAELMAGTEPEVIDDDGRRPRLLIRLDGSWR